MPSPPVLLFSYGTLQQTEVQLETFGRLLNGAADTLPGYRLSMVEITDPAVVATSGSDRHPIATASADPDQAVDGMVFEITEAELMAGDGYEVSDYQRVAARLSSGRTAWVYVKA